MNIIPFSFESHQVRVIAGDDGEPWFIAKDVAGILDYSDAHEMCSRLDEDDKQNRQIAGFGNRGVIVINESGLYSAILGSRKPEAKKFKKWVTSEVLPAIRKTGAYIPNIDSINHLPPALAKQVGGIVKGIVHKELGQAINDALAYYLPDGENDSHLSPYPFLHSKTQASAMQASIHAGLQGGLAYARVVPGARLSFMRAEKKCTYKPVLARVPVILA
jgi:hypothetical protein